MQDFVPSRLKATISQRSHPYHKNHELKSAGLKGPHEDVPVLQHGGTQPLSRFDVRASDTFTVDAQTSIWVTNKVRKLVDKIGMTSWFQKLWTQFA